MVGTDRAIARINQEYLKNRTVNPLAMARAPKKTETRAADFISNIGRQDVWRETGPLIGRKPVAMPSETVKQMYLTYTVSTLAHH